MAKDETPTPEELMERHLEARRQLAAIPAEQWHSKIEEILARPEVRQAAMELEAISEILPEGQQVTAVLRQASQGLKVLPMAIRAGRSTPPQG